MHQGRLLAIAAALTAFLLVVAGALAARLAQPEAPAMVVTPPATTTNDTARLDPAIEALIRERESAYQKALEEANQRLQEANRQLVQLQGSGTTTTATTPNVVVSPEQAAQIATTYRGGGTVRTVEQEQFEEGIVIYAVQFTDGTDVYVDATSGSVVYASLNMSADHDGSTGEDSFMESDHDHDHDRDEDESVFRFSLPDQQVFSHRREEHEDHDD